MAKGYILYNPLAGNGKSEADAKSLQTILGEEPEYYDITQITNYADFIGGMEKDDSLVIVGGDGTLNRFVNDTKDIEISQQILYLPSGSGNDFARDLGKENAKEPFCVTPYLKNLPSVEVNGKRYHFINGIGFGINGYCCQVGEEMKKTSDKKINYAGIAIKGLLFYFKARNAKLTVDGREYTYNKVWIAPTMLGTYYGGGMIPTPGQERLNEKKTLSVMMFYGGGRLRSLCAFPSIFKGAHVKHKKMVALHTGRSITVEFDRPTPLQIDGETILDVTSYTATAAPVETNAACV